MAEQRLALITFLSTDARPDNSLPGDQPSVRPPVFPTNPIVIPPDSIGPGVPPVHVWIPVFPTAPIVIPPGSLAPGLPTHPIVIPPPCPGHPIVLPPGSVGDAKPEHPIVLPQPPVVWPPVPNNDLPRPPLGTWGPNDPRPGFGLPDVIGQPKK